jgi:CBS domain-containing protein
MKVFEVLAEQPRRRRPKVVRSDAPARAAVRRLAESDGCVVVVTSPRGRVVGTITDHDIVSALACNGEPLSALSAVDVMGRSPVCCRSDDDVADVLEAMARHGQRHVPVVDGDSVAGAVSIIDLIGDPAPDLDARLGAFVERDDRLSTRPGTRGGVGGR